MDSNSRLSTLQRQLNLPITEHNAFFLWGPRKIGKTTFLKQHLPNAYYVDLLNRKLVSRYKIDPESLSHFFNTVMARQIFLI